LRNASCPAGRCSPGSGRTGRPAGGRSRPPTWAWTSRIFTHYERAENLAGLTSKLEEELLRMRAILDHANPDSLIVQKFHRHAADGRPGPDRSYDLSVNPHGPADHRAGTKIIA
jgi:hypothetical protein